MLCDARAEVRDAPPGGAPGYGGVESGTLICSLPEGHHGLHFDNSDNVEWRQGGSGNVPPPRPPADEMGTAPGPADPGSSTAAQRLEIVTALSDLNIYGRAARLRLCSDLGGRVIASPLELSFAEAGAILAALAMRKEAAGNAGS